MKRFLLSSMLMVFSFAIGFSVSFGTESLKYKITYKWGLVDKQAGTAVLSIRPSAGGYTTKLTARSDPWADKFYSVRDTLLGNMDKSLRPSIYTKITHEKKKFAKDVVKFSRSGVNVIGHCYRFRPREGVIKVDSLVLKASGTTIDMLTAFYYMRSFNYENMKVGTSNDLNIFSGKKCEKLHITFKGVEQVKMDKGSHEAYHITFTFTMGQRKKTSDDMDAWLSTDSQHVPLKLEGKLPVGKIRCFLI